MTRWAVTVNPDLKTVINKAQKLTYGAVNNKIQHKWLSTKIRDAFYASALAQPGEEVKIVGFFELTKKANVHFHAIVKCNEHAIERFKDYIYGHCGRWSRYPNKSLIDACITVKKMSEVDEYRTANGMVSWREYIIKEQDQWRPIFAPIMITHTEEVKEITPMEQFMIDALDEIVLSDKDE